MFYQCPFVVHRYFSISVFRDAGSVLDEKRLMTFPSLSIKNLAKFHSIALPRCPLVSSFNHVKRGEASLPLTLILAKRGKVV